VPRDKVLGFNLARLLNSSDEFHKTVGETRSVIQYTHYFAGASKDPRFRKRLSIPDERARPVPAKDGEPEIGPGRCQGDEPQPLERYPVKLVHIRRL
jgi:hypothetical protein